jgi:acyl-CoA synthetase (AMP-forming)/AMP-acid ligase II
MDSALLQYAFLTHISMQLFHDVNLVAFASLLTSSNLAAFHYIENTTMQHRKRSMHEKKDRIVALLSPSCADLLVTLFGALRLGYGVLLLAYVDINLGNQPYSYHSFSPQNTDEAIAHLCKITLSTHLICHPTLYRQGCRALGTDPAISIVEMCPREVWQNVQSNRPLIEVVLSPSDEADMTALVMHTSGSTGMQKVLLLLLSMLLPQGELRCFLAHLPPT